MKRKILQIVVQSLMVFLGFLFISGIVLGPLGIMGHGLVKEAIIFVVVHSIFTLGGIYLLNKLFKKLL